jgi:hypothetical protein
MKKLIAIGIFVLMVSSLANAQTSFSVKPGLNFNGANIGKVYEKAAPYVGFQFVNLTEKYENENHTSGGNKDKIYVFMPYVGSKFFVYENENIKGAIHTTLFKPIYYYREINDGEVDENNNDESIRFWGAELGFGMEYFFDEHFSIGGEFGYRFGFLGNKYDDPGSAYWRSEQQIINMTYVSASMNFYLF